MNNNVFVKLNKKKFNPDIENKLNNLSNERIETKFNLSKTIYNPITGIIPPKLNSQKDLFLEINNSNIDINSLVIKKEKERQEQNDIYKPIQTKIVNNTNTIQNTIDVPSDKTLHNNDNRNDYIKTYHELKNGKQVKNITVDKNYDNILSGLKNLGIFN